MRRPEYWRAQINAFDIDIAVEIGKAESYLAANPRRRYSDLGRFMHNWLKWEAERQA